MGIISFLKEHWFFIILFFILLISSFSIAQGFTTISKDVYRDKEKVYFDNALFNITLPKENIDCSGYYSRNNTGFEQKCCLERELNYKLPSPIDITLDKISFQNIISAKTLKSITSEFFESYQENITDYDSSCLFAIEGNTDSCVIGSHNESRSKWVPFSLKSFKQSLKTRTCFYVPYPSTGIFDDSFYLNSLKYIIPLPTWNTTTQQDWDAGTHTNTTSNTTGVLFLNSTEYPESYKDENLVLWMHFNESSGTTAYDMSQYGNNGSLTNMGTGSLNNLTADGNYSGWNSSGKYANSISFDGKEDYVLIPRTPSTNITSKFTISAWVKYQLFLGDVFIVGRTGSSYDYGLYLNPSPFIWVRQDNGTANGISYTFQSNNSEWNHILGSFNGSDLLFYFNGILRSSIRPVQNTSLISQTSGTELRIGQGLWNSKLFAGTIDEVAIWNRSLSQDQISNLYRNKRGIYQSKINNTNQESLFTHLNFTFLENSTLSNLSFQVRSCDDSLCSGESFVGSTNDSNSWFNSSGCIGLSTTSSSCNISILNKNKFIQFQSLFTRDNAGNPQIVNVSVGYTEARQPNITILSPSNTTYNLTSVFLAVTADEPIARWNFSNNTQSNIVFNNNMTLNTTEGSNNVTICGSNGNYMNCSRLVFTVDTTLPFIRIISPENRSYDSQRVNLDITTNSDAVNMWYIQESGGVAGTNTTFTNNKSIEVKKGTNIVTAYANDSAGNVNSSIVTFVSTFSTAGGGGGGGDGGAKWFVNKTIMDIFSKDQEEMRDNIEESTIKYIGGTLLFVTLLIAGLFAVFIFTRENHSKKEEYYEEV